MRNAALDHIWRSAQTAPATTSLLGLSLENLNGVTGTDLSLEGPLVAICGFNGTGKTTLLSAIQALLGGGEQATFNPSDTRIQNAQITGTLKFRGQRHELTKAAGDRHNSGIPAGFRLLYINPTYDAVTLQRTLQERADISTLLASGNEGQPFEQKELEEVSRIVGKSYSSIMAYDLTHEFVISEVASTSETPTDPELDVASSALGEISTVLLSQVPYFEVSVGQVRYDSRTMGLGELAAIYLYWSLRAAEKGSIVLLEEPESFISPASQVALGAALAKFASENKFTLIFTSHSESLVSRLSAKNVVINIPHAMGYAAATIAEDSHEHLQALRLQPRKEGMAICEDWGAVAFLRGILKRAGHFALSRFDFIPAFSESNVARLLEFYPHRVGATPIFGVLDGDVRQSFADGRLKWPHCFLPGDVAPEKILIDAVVKNVEAFCEKLRLPQRKVVLAIGSTQGMDYHDFIGQLVSGLPCSHEDIVNFAIELMHEDEGWRARFEEFVTMFENCFPKNLTNP